jgi:hypothetical protein
MIFSDNYTVHERYSVLRQEKICTYSEMPWLYTPLFDERYKPNNIITSSKDNLNAVLGFEYLIKEREVIKREFNELGILHNGDDILSYETKFQYRYCTVQQERNYFKQKTRTEHLEDVYGKIDNIVSSTPVGHTMFVGMKHDINGIANAIFVEDKYYDLSHYNNDYLENLNSYSKRNYVYCLGDLCVGENDKISFRMRFDYPKSFYHNTTDRSTENLLKSSSKINVSYQQAVDRHLYGMRYYKFLTDEQATYIANLCEDMTKDFMFDLEFVFDGSELEDVICSRVLYKEFEEIEVKKTMFPWYTETV